MKQFKFPEASLDDLDAKSAAALITAAADIALIVDAEGIIQDVALGSDDLVDEGYEKWIGRPWAETATEESRPKIEALLKETGAGRGRPVNHPSGRGPDVPILYSTLRFGPDGKSVAVGRDLRSMIALQQRLVEAQQSMERDYWRLRHMETRYQLMFQTTAEAVLIVDATTQKVTEANPAAVELFGDSGSRLVGRGFPEGFDADSTRALQTLLAGTRALGRADELQVRLADGKRAVMVSATLIRQEKGSLFLVRLTAPANRPATAMPRGRPQLLAILENAPDGLVVTDMQGRILTANAAFLGLTQTATVEQMRGESLERWLGRPGVDLNVLMANLKQHGSVRLFATTVRGEYGGTAEVEISAVSVPGGEQPCLGFSFRNIINRLPAARGSHEMPRTVEQLADSVGRVPLRDLVREATDVIERLCIEAALELTRDNRASAAEMLGLSRQSLYVKLRRFGMVDQEIGSEIEPED